MRIETKYQIINIKLESQSLQKQFEFMDNASLLEAMRYGILGGAMPFIVVLVQLFNVLQLTLIILVSILVLTWRLFKKLLGE